MKFSDEEAEQGTIWGGSDRILKSEQKNWFYPEERSIDRLTRDCILESRMNIKGHPVEDTQQDATIAKRIEEIVLDR